MPLCRALSSPWSQPHGAVARCLSLPSDLLLVWAWQLLPYLQVQTFSAQDHDGSTLQPVTACQEQAVSWRPPCAGEPGPEAQAHGGVCGVTGFHAGSGAAAA